MFPSQTSSFLFSRGIEKEHWHEHRVKIVQMRIFFWSVFPVFGVNTEIYGVNLCIQSEYGKI